MCVRVFVACPKWFKWSSRGNNISGLCQEFAQANLLSTNLENFAQQQPQRYVSTHSFHSFCKFRRILYQRKIQNITFNQQTYTHTHTTQKLLWRRVENFQFYKELYWTKKNVMYIVCRLSKNALLTYYHQHHHNQSVSQPASQSIRTNIDFSCSF